MYIQRRMVLRWILEPVLVGCIVLPIVWTQFLASPSRIPFDHLRDHLLLEFSYIEDVEHIASIMTQRTRYRNNGKRSGYPTLRSVTVG